MLIAVFAASCASSSKDFSKMADDSLIAEVKAVEKKIDEKKVPKFEPTGDATIDALIKPYVDAATENAPKALALVAACRSSAIIELVNKSVDAEFKKQNIASPTSQQRVDVTAKVLKVLKPEERKQWDEWVAKNRKQIEAEKANSAKLGAQAVAVLADLALKAKAAAQGGMAAAFTGGKAALAVNNGIDQINGVKDFTAPADELIARYSDKLAANDKMAVGNMQGK
jgi:hypothetical protein